MTARLTIAPTFTDYRPLSRRLIVGETVRFLDNIPRVDGVQHYPAGPCRARLGHVWLGAADGRIGQADLGDVLVQWTCNHELLAALSPLCEYEVDARCSDCGSLVRMGRAA